ncbi:MAG: VWA domain-containing protein [Nocardioides sp.]
MTDQRSLLLDRHLAFVQALRAAGLSVSLAEAQDSVTALSSVGWGERGVVRDVYAATLVKRHSQRPTFEAVFDLFFPRLVGGGTAADEDPATADRTGADATGHRDGADALAAYRDRLGEALEGGDDAAVRDLAVEAVGRFGAMPGRGPGLSSWSAYTALRRITAQELTARVVEALLAEGRADDEAARVADQRVARFGRLVEDDARRRIAEEKGPEHVADVALRPSLDRLDFGAARAGEIEEMRRSLYPLSRRLATRLARERRARRGGPLDFRRTVRVSLSTGGVPLTTLHRPRRPHRTELVVLCDVSGSVASFARFTLLLVFALQEQFSRVRAFTFVDDLVEVTRHFKSGADVADVMAELAASSAHAARFGRTHYGRALGAFEERYADAVGPSTSLLVLGDARSNYSDLNLEALRSMAGRARQAWWLNPEHPRHWGTGDSAAAEYGAIVPMVECRNLVQLGEFVHDLA